MLTAQPHLKADAEAGLHDLTHALIGQQSADGAQQQRPQHLKDLHEDHLVTGWVGPHKPGGYYQNRCKKASGVPVKRLCMYNSQAWIIC